MDGGCRPAGYSVFSLWSLLHWACSLRLDVPPLSPGQCLSSVFSLYSPCRCGEYISHPSVALATRYLGVHSCGEYARILLYSLRGLVSASPGSCRYRILCVSSLCVLPVFSLMLCRRGDALVSRAAGPLLCVLDVLSSAPAASLPRLLACWITGLASDTRDALAGLRACCRGRALLPSRWCGERCRCWRPPFRCCADPHRGPQ